MSLIFDLSVIGLAGSTAAFGYAKLTGKQKLENRAGGIFAFAFAGWMLSLNHYDEPHIWQPSKPMQEIPAQAGAIPKQP